MIHSTKQQSLNKKSHSSSLILKKYTYGKGLNDSIINALHQYIYIYIYIYIRKFQKNLSFFKVKSEMLWQLEEYA